jgi:GMP synthase (glutamine-hydrolysing)
VSTQRRVIVLQHVGCEKLGTIAGALDAAKIVPQYIRSFEGETVPKELGGADGLIVMGGPQSVYEQDRFPFLREETRLIHDALRNERPILGVCLGSQLLAATLGAEVKAGRQKEIGWFEVALTGEASDDSLLAGIPKIITGFHWHGDLFTLPAGAAALASSALTPLQAYRYGKNAYGFLFHMEVTGTQVAEMVALFADELHAAGVDARAILSGTKKHLPALQKYGASVFSEWVKSLG